MKTSNSKVSSKLSELAVRVGADLDGDGDIVITGAATIESAGASDISFVANPKYAKHIASTKAGALVLDRKTSSEGRPALRHDNPYLTFAQIIDILYPLERKVVAGIDDSAVVSSDAIVADTAGVGPLCRISDGATVGDDCQLVSNVFVGCNVSIGDNCIIYPGVSINDGCKIGNNVILHSGVVVGSDGFGFAPTAEGIKKIQQIGWVEIGDDVEIGANCTIDRGALGPTRIGRGTKIDNLVQIAHNVEIGEHCIIVSQVGISGSTKLGNGVVLAGQVGVVGHIELGDGVQVGAQSGVARSIPAGKKMFGSPALDATDAMKIEAAMKRLPDLLKRVRALEKKSE